MNQHESLLKKAIHEAEFEADEHLPKRDVRDLMLSLNDGDEPPEIAAKTLYALCLNAGRFNGRVFAVTAILNFLAETAQVVPRAGKIDDCRQELVGLMLSSCTLPKLRAWAKRWYV